MQARVRGHRVRGHQPVQVVGSGDVGVGRTAPTAFHASSVSPYGYSLSMRTSTGRPCPTMRSNVVLSRSCMLKRVTSVRGRAGRKADQAPGRRWAGRHEAPALPLHLPGAHAACPCGAEATPLACCGYEDCVVGSGRRGEREHESGDAPAQTRSGAAGGHGCGFFLEARAAAGRLIARLRGAHLGEVSRARSPGPAETEIHGLLSHGSC